MRSVPLVVLCARRMWSMRNSRHAMSPAHFVDEVLPSFRENQLSGRAVKERCLNEVLELLYPASDHGASDPQLARSKGEALRFDYPDECLHAQNLSNRPPSSSMHWQLAYLDITNNMCVCCRLQ